MPALTPPPRALLPAQYSCQNGTNGCGLGTPCVLDESMCSTGEVAALDSNWCED